MLSKEKIHQITSLFKEVVKKKYNISDLKLFGSSARGDFSTTSDIDIMVQLPKVNRAVEEDLFNIAYDLELKYECLIDVIVLPQNLKSSIPLYQNILKEGIAI